MSERNGSPLPDQLRAVGMLAGARPDAPELADCDPAAVAGWLLGDPEFIAESNWVRSYRAERLRADVGPIWNWFSRSVDPAGELRLLIKPPRYYELQGPR